MKQSGIYKITCVENGKIYIGSSADLANRLRTHFRMLKLGSHRNRHLQTAYNKYGESAFTKEVIELVPLQEQLIEREQYWLDLTRCYERSIGFNICIIADSSLGVKRSDSFKQKISQQNMNRSEEQKQKTKEAVIAANTGRTPWNKGIEMPLDKRRKTTNKGRKFPDRKLTPEGYEKRCLANRKPRPKGYLDKRSLTRAKTYYFVCPNGGQIKVENLSQFCKSMGLNQGHMAQVGRGLESAYKGWSLDLECC